MRKILSFIFVFVSMCAIAQKPTLKGGLSNFVSSKTIYPSYSSNNCIEGTVNVGFKLNPKGEITQTKVTKGIIGDLDKEALRLIKLTSNKWQVPAGYDTTSLIVVPVNFSLANQDCRMVSKAEINQAIADYYKEEQIEKTIYSYYQAKEKGEADVKDQAKIELLKQTINIDDDYLNARIETGLKKIKQGDITGACEDFKFVKYMGSTAADKQLAKYCK